jgi:outer membrane receptor for ferrienterochelin and colicins
VAAVGSTAIMSLALLAPPVQGQSVDYGALQQLFKEPVTTSVTGSPQRVSEVPATMEIVTAEDIRRSGAKDIPGVLRHVGGVDTLEWGNDNIDVGVRGYDQAYSSRLLVLVDGRQVYADNYGYTPWSSIPIELGAIRQIEIVKGPSTALFGFNAVGGVINIITYNPLYDNINSISLTAGTQQLATGSIVITRKFGERAGVRFTAGVNSDNDFSTPTPADFLREREHRRAFKISSVIRLNDKMQLVLEGAYADAHVNEIAPDFELDNTEYHAPSVKAQLKAESRLGLFQASAYTNWLNTTDPSGYLNLPYIFKNRVTVVQLQDVFRHGANHIFRGAAEYRHNTESTTPTTGASVHYDVFSVSGMWNWRVTPTISVTNALRMDHLALARDGYLPPGYPLSNSDWNRTITQPSFNSGLVWKPRDTDSIRFMVSRGVQLPSLALGGALLVDAPSFKFTGSPLLKPSAVTNYEIGWDHVFPGPHILLRVSAFDQDSFDLMASEGEVLPSPGGPYTTPSNIGSSDATGLELGLSGTLPQNFRWGVNYRPEWISDHFTPDDLLATEDVDFDDTTPVHLVKANLGWSNGRWEIDGYLQYHSIAHGLWPIATGEVTQIPIAAFVAMDSRVAYKLTDRMTWSVSGQNLTHASQLQTPGPAVERRVLGTLSIHF